MTFTWKALSPDSWKAWEHLQRSGHAVRRSTRRGPRVTCRRMFLGHVPLRALPVLCLVAAAAAQQRAAAIGTVRDATGRPVADADVTLTGALPPPHDPVAAPDVVLARTGPDGAFRVELVPGLDYSAWATGPAQDGRRLASGIVERVRAGAVVTLSARSIAAPARLCVADFDRWPGLDVRAVQLWFGTPPAAPVTLPLDDEGTAALPPLPDAQVDVMALDGRGEPRFGRGLRPEPTMTLHALAPHPVPLLVLDAGGAPVAGAVVHQQVHLVSGHDRALWRRAGTTDASGRLLVHAVGADPYEHGGGHGVLFAAAAEGTAESFSGWCAGVFWRDGERVPAPAVPADGAPPPVEFVLHAAAVRRGRLLDGGEPVAGRGIFLLVDCPLRLDTWGRVGLSRRHAIRTAADGSFALPPLPRHIDALHLAVAPPPDAPAGAPLLGPRHELPEAPLVVDLAALPVLELQVLEPGRAPATGAVAMLLPARTDRSASSPRRLVCDRAGRVAVPVEPGRFLLFAHDGGHGSAQVLAVPEGRDVVAAEVLLEPLPCVRGTIRDAEGRPVGGAAIHVTSMQADAREPADELQVLLRHHGHFLNQQLAREVRSDGTGAFRLPFLDLPGVTFGATTSSGGRFELASGEAVEVVPR